MRVNFNISLKEMISWENVKYRNISQEGFKTSTDSAEFGTVKKKNTIFYVIAQRDTIFKDELFQISRE